MDKFIVLRQKNTEFHEMITTLTESVNTSNIERITSNLKFIESSWRAFTEENGSYVAMDSYDVYGEILSLKAKIEGINNSINKTSCNSAQKEYADYKKLTTNIIPKSVSSVLGIFFDQR